VILRDLQSKRVLVLGYGLEGSSTHRYLAAAGAGRIGIADRREDLELVAPADDVWMGPRYLDQLADYDIVVRAPGVPAFGPELTAARQAGVAVTSQTNELLTAGRTVVGVTGTKGKSTTASLLAAMLREAGREAPLVGNIGTPPLDELPSASPEAIFVAELSSYQLEDAVGSPQYAILLGLRFEHLDRHGSFDAYVDAKSNIFRHQDSNGVLVFDADTPRNVEVARTAPSRTFGFSLDDPSSTATIRDGRIAGRAGGTGAFLDVMAVAEIPIPGEGNRRNVLAATAMALILDTPPDAIRAAVLAFEALPHRIQFVGERAGIRFYDDSIATIPEAAQNAIDALGVDVRTLIAGGHDRGIDYDGFGRYVAAHPSIRTLILFPPSGERIEKALAAHLKAGDRRALFHVTSMPEAVEIALANTPAGSICLLSPASASFGTFVDYRDRGDQFKRALGFA
jgi:UDP-N-acetylmuramoylalanine--D-glutamate ligase